MAARKELSVYSRRLRQAREASGLSQRGLGIKVNIDEFAAGPRINRYETGVHQPHLKIQQQIAKVLGQPLAFFYAEDDGLAEVITDYARRGKRKR